MGGRQIFPLFGFIRLFNFLYFALCWDDNIYILFHFVTIDTLTGKKVRLMSMPEYRADQVRYTHSYHDM